MEDLKEKYYDPKTGLISYDKFIKKFNLNISNKLVKEFIENQETHQISRKPVKREFNTIYVPNVRDSYHIDLMDYSRYEYHNYRYILCVVDVYSRFAMCKPLTNKTMENILNNMKKIFYVMGIPKAINADQEFNKKLFNEYYKEKNIKTYFSQPNQLYKNAIVERFNRTLAMLLQRWRQAHKRYDWYKVLDDIVDNYNNTYHSTIKTTPNKIFNGDDFNRQKIYFVKHDFKIGDKVRVLLQRTIYDKGDKLIYSKDVHTITNINKYRIYLDDKPRYYKPYQLLKVNDVQTYDNTKDVVIITNPSRKKQNKLKNIEGIDEKNIIDGKRARK